MNEVNHMGFVDLSPYFLMEATGDSESDFMEVGVWRSSKDANFDADDDDAESCSFDLSESSTAQLPRLVVDDEFRALDGGARCNRHDDLAGEFEEEEKEDDGGADATAVDQDCSVVAGYGGKRKCRMMKKKTKKSNDVSVDSTTTTNTELMNEREKDRLFWEACLAS